MHIYVGLGQAGCGMVRAISRIDPHRKHRIAVDCGSGGMSRSVGDSAVIDVRDPSTTSNIWSDGYSCHTTLVDRVVEAYRKEAEDVDQLEGAVLCHSFGGGCGGVACRVLETLKDAGLVPFVAHAVLDSLPHLRAPCERMNCAFTALWMLQLSDVVLHFDAASVLERVDTRKKGSTVKKVLEARSILRDCAGRIESVFAPENGLSDLVVQMVPLRASKMVMVSSVFIAAPAPTSWPDIVKKKLPIPRLGRPVALATMGIARGFRTNLDQAFRAGGGSKVNVDIQAQFHHRVKINFRSTSANPHAHRFVCGPAFPSHKSLALVANCPSYNASILGSVVDQAEEIYRAGAYRHVF